MNTNNIINSNTSKNEGTNLEIYYYLDLDSNQDVLNIERCLRVFITTQQSNYKLTRLDKFVLDKEKSEFYENTEYDINKCDIVKRGLIILSRMFNELKLKTKNETWFLFIGNGDISMSHKDVSLVLLNKNPYYKECCYIVNKKQLNVIDTMNKEEKFINIKNFTKSLYKIFSDNKTIKYNTIDIN